MQAARFLYRPHPAIDLELGIELCDMSFDGIGRDTKRASDLLVGLSLRQGFQHLQLPVRYAKRFQRSAISVT